MRVIGFRGVTFEQPWDESSFVKDNCCLAYGPAIVNHSTRPASFTSKPNKPHKPNKPNNPNNPNDANDPNDPNDANDPNDPNDANDANLYGIVHVSLVSNC